MKSKNVIDDFFLMADPSNCVLSNTNRYCACLSVWALKKAPRPASARERDDAGRAKGFAVQKHYT